jgi:hypothetical protein
LSHRVKDRRPQCIWYVAFSEAAVRRSVGVDGSLELLGRCHVAITSRTTLGRALDRHRLVVRCTGELRNLLS